MGTSWALCPSGNRGLVKFQALAIMPASTFLRVHAAGSRIRRGPLMVQEQGREAGQNISLSFHSCSLQEMEDSRQIPAEERHHVTAHDLTDLIVRETFILQRLRHERQT